MIRKSLILIGMVLLSFQLWAEEPEWKSGHPDTYQVIKGDTLWGISSRFLNNPWMWPEIWHVNPQIENPHLIYPGDTIKLIYLEGVARLTVKRGDAGKTVKLTPNGDVKLSPSIHVLPLEEPIPAIPLDAISQYLSANRVVSQERILNAPYVLMGEQRHVVVGAGTNFYAKGDFTSEAVPIYGVYRQGQTYIDPETKEVLGIEARDIGMSKLKATSEGNIATLEAISTTQEIRMGDRLLTSEGRRVESMFYPSGPEDEVKGEIMGVEGGVSQIGSMDVVALNLGERNGVDVGNVLAVYQKGETIKDPVTDESVKLPDERAGLVMVFNTFEKMSYGIVLTTDRVLRVGDTLKNP